MADREKLIDLLCKAHSKAIDEILSDDISYAKQLEIEADYLLDNGVTFTPVIPGPTTEDPNIMELCFHNGERHMKEKVITMLQDILDQEDGLCLIDLSEVIKAVEDL